MTQQQAIDRISNGGMLFVHTPAPQQEKFYFFAPEINSQ
jgi:hypothetical protein